MTKNDKMHFFDYKVKKVHFLICVKRCGQKSIQNKWFRLFRRMFGRCYIKNTKFLRRDKNYEKETH